MKKQHSFHQLFFHLVFTTKNREHLIRSPAEGQMLADFFAVKTHDLESYIEEFGCWREHVHLLVRIPPKLSLATLYGQLKGFAAHAWNKRHPNQPFRWQDGTFSTTVDPENCQGLREYIRGQWKRHESGALHSHWEPQLPSPGAPAPSPKP